MPRIVSGRQPQEFFRRNVTVVKVCTFNTGRVIKQSISSSSIFGTSTPTFLPAILASTTAEGRVERLTSSAPVSRHIRYISCPSKASSAVKDLLPPSDSPTVTFPALPASISSRHFRSAGVVVTPFVCWGDVKLGLMKTLDVLSIYFSHRMYSHPAAS